MTVEDFMTVLDNTDIDIILYEDIDDDCIWSGTADELGGIDKYDDWTITLMDVSTFGKCVIIELEVKE